jgi:hypothetical protein
MSQISHKDNLIYCYLNIKKNISSIFFKLNYIFINYLDYFKNSKINRVTPNQSLHNLFIFH